MARTRLRQDVGYLLQGFAISAGILGVLATLAGVLLLIAIALAPGRIGELLAEMVPANLPLSLLLIAIIVGLYLWALARVRLVSKRLSDRLIWLLVIATAVSLAIALIG